MKCHLKNMLRVIIFSIIMHHLSLYAETIHISSSGENGAKGTEDKPLRTIQEGIDRAKAGDTVLIHPGVYFESIEIKKTGKKNAPIRIMADRVVKNRVIITGAVKAIREKKQTWELVDPTKLIYRTPLNYKPVRVLADHVDLMPYPGLGDLKEFKFLDSNYPGHSHGFAWSSSENMLYVRLHKDKRYNISTNPNDLTMAVAPKTGGGKYGGSFSANPEESNIRFPLKGSANVIIDGITFETPGIAAIYTKASDVVIRNCWFYGCRTSTAGVRDNNNPANRITIEYCYYTQFPAYSDIEETMKRYNGEFGKYIKSWQRKGNYPNRSGVGRKYAYETALVKNMGQGWIIRNNHIFESFEGISASAHHFSKDTLIINNRFERICDNAVEAENLSRNLTIAHNLIIDTYEAFSWQPLGVKSPSSLPGPVYIYDNIVYQTPKAKAMWDESGSWSGILKIGGKDSTWEKLYGKGKEQNIYIPGGLWVVNNTFIKPRGRLLTYMNSPEWPIKNVFFLNNIIATWRTSASAKREAGCIVFDYNIIWSTMRPGNIGFTDLKLVAGLHGKYFDKIYIPKNWQKPLNALTDIPTGMTNATIPSSDILSLPKEITFSRSIGAITTKMQKVGPQVRKVSIWKRIFAF